MFEKNNVIIKLSFIFLKVYVTVADSGHPFSKFSCIQDLNNLAFQSFDF
jgi:hypothetical protein